MSDFSRFKSNNLQSLQGVCSSSQFLLLLKVLKTAFGHKWKQTFHSCQGGLICHHTNLEFHIIWNRLAPILVVLGCAFKLTSDPFSGDSKLVQFSLFSAVLCVREALWVWIAMLLDGPCVVCVFSVTERSDNSSHPKPSQVTTGEENSEKQPWTLSLNSQCPLCLFYD